MNRESLLPSVAGLFATSGRRTLRVGVELEQLTRDAHDGSVVRVERVRRASLGASYAGWLGFEPGGQVELSLPCHDTVAELARTARSTVGELKADCAAAGVLLDPVPVDDRGHVVPLQLTSRRYTGMQQHFDGIGPAGRTMMRLTASTQVCLDWWPGRAGLEQWRLLQLAGPVVAALFAHGGGAGSRLATWLEVDPRRTAFDGRLLGADPVAGYVDFAVHAGSFALPTDPAAAVAHHLSTLFPPIRPRGHYLEVRFLDAQPDHLVPVATTLLATLLFDDECRRGALRLLAGDEGQLALRWRLAALVPGELADEGLALVELCLAGIRRAPGGYLPEGVEDRLREHLEAQARTGAA